MNFIPVRKLAEKIGLVLLGVAITLVGLVAFALVEMAKRPSLEELQRESTLDYTKKRQTEIGVNCTTLPKDLIAPLSAVDQTVLARRGAGENWRPLVTEAIESELEKYSEFAFTCRLLYTEGKNGVINGLQHLRVLEEINHDFELLVILLRHGPREKNCDAECRDEMFNRMRNAHAETVNKLRSANQAP